MSTHGHTIGRVQSRTYQCWRNMIRRCYDKGREDYVNYGGRGIGVCDEWRSSFETFLQDMGAAPMGMSLDREDNDKDYSRANCRWATRTEQNRNMRTTKRFALNGREMTQREWEIELGLSSGALWHRLKNGWSLPVALSTPRGALPR